MNNEPTPLAIESVTIDPSGRLLVCPRLNKGQDFSAIYRDASGIRWDPSMKALIAYEPERWEHLALFKQILKAISNEYGERLIIKSDTKWFDVPPQLRREIEDHFKNRLPTKSEQ